MQKLNIGDKVITLVDIYNCKKGTIGTVTEIRDSDYEISFINKENKSDYWYVSPDFTLRGIQDEDIENWVKPLKKEEINNMKHPHAELMLQYAQDAMETDKPWERWEVNMSKSPEDYWTILHSHPDWNSTNRYRVKPKTININGFEVPEPVKTLAIMDTFYCVVLDDPRNGLTVKGIYNPDCPIFGDTYEPLVQRGLCHRTKEAAELHAKALLSFTKKEECS